MRKIKYLVICFIMLLIVGCSNKEKEVENVLSDATKFKEEYESVNGNTNDNGKEYRPISIDENNPIIYKSAEEVVKMIDDEESFIVYFGFNTCPWCRSIVPTLLEVAKDLNATKIYYVDVKNIRDVLEVKDGKISTKVKGSEGYYDLLDRLDSVLDKYELQDGEKIIDSKEKRIYAPNVVAIVNGKAKKIATGISSKQDDAYMDLTEDMKKETYEDFEEVIEMVYSKSQSCSINKGAC